MRDYSDLLCFICLPLLAWAAEGGLKTPSQQFSLEDAEPHPSLSFLPDAGDNVTRNFVSSTLGDNMVLQRDTPAVVWGYSKPGVKVKATLWRHITNSYDTATTTSKDDSNVVLHESFSPVLQVVTNVEEDGTWRLTLPPQPASLTPQVIEITSNTGQKARLDNVLFGDVYICGGQSNMNFGLPGQVNGTQVAELGDKYPHIRVFTVGTGTRSTTPLPDLQTVRQKWSVASKESLLSGDAVFKGYFSAVCWFFGKEVADGLNNQVPIGLISNNWGGTAIEVWMPKGDLFNAMIYPYMVGPMALTGFTWYQGEANTGSQASADTYAHHFPTMIEEWRLGFRVPEAYFGFVQLSTWCPKTNPASVPEMRVAQMKALDLPGKIGYSTNADHGAGCNIHPADKSFCGARLGRSALALQYGYHLLWRSPSYSKASLVVADDSAKYKSKTNPSIAIEFHDTSDKGLYILEIPYNSRLNPKDFDCKQQQVGVCAGPMVLLNGKGWVDAKIGIQNGNQLLMTPTSFVDGDTIVATSYGWGSVPMMSLYDAGTDLPVLGWNEKI